MMFLKFSLFATVFLAQIFHNETQKKRQLNCPAQNKNLCMDAQTRYQL